MISILSKLLILVLEFSIPTVRPFAASSLNVEQSSICLQNSSNNSLTPKYIIYYTKNILKCLHLFPD